MEPGPPESHEVAAIDLLLTIGYVDGQLHAGEQAFIRRYVDRLIAAAPDSKDTVEAALTRLESEFAALAAEVTAHDDKSFLSTRLKVRAVTLFRAFSPADQRVALELLQAVTQVDGTISAEEQDLHTELLAYFHATPSLPGPPVAALPDPIPLPKIEAPARVKLPQTTHPFLDALEHRFSADPATLHAQLGTDYNLIFQAITAWERQRSRGNGRLIGAAEVGQLPHAAQFLDNHVHVLRPDRPTELVVLGDVHGCYGCLKAALLQSGFIDRALKYQQDPANSTDVKLVLLGDYIDRGHFGFEGVMRAALQLFVNFPDQVFLLRGNHELFIRRHDEVIASAVTPAESLPGLAAIAPIELLDAYRHLFEHMPSSLLFDRILFVHGGIPRDDTFTERYRDLSSLDDRIIRFEMLWSDPEQTDTVPRELQHASPRFSFGKEQFVSFMNRIGCTTLIRGHEQIEAGFVTNFDLPNHRLHTLFSAGGANNSDLPVDSRYRSVVPAALTIQWKSGATSIRSWPIDYAPFVGPESNGLYR